MNLPPGTKRTTRPGSPRRALAAAPPAAAPPPAYFTLHPTRPPFSSATRDEAEKFLHVPSWILNKNTAAAAAGAGAAPPPPPRAPGPARRGRSLPGDCGGEPLLAAAAPGARRPSSSRQQSQKEEVPRSRRAPRSAAISSLRAAAAAAAAAPRSPRRSASRALQPVPRCRLGSRGRRRRCSSPARPGPRGPSRGRGHSGAPPSCRGAERGGERRVSTFRGGGAGGARSPGSRRRHPPPTPAPHTSARGAETAGGGGGGRGPGARTPAHAQARAFLARTPSAPRGARPAPIPAAASRARSPPPSPRSRGRVRGARAWRCCWRQGNPGEADPPPPPRVCPQPLSLAPPLPPPHPGEKFPSHLPRVLRLSRLKGEALRARACPGGRSESAPLLCLGPGPLYRASEETERPPGGNLGAQSVGPGVYVLAKNNSDPARLLLGPGAAPVGGGRPRRR